MTILLITGGILIAVIIAYARWRLRRPRFVRREIARNVIVTTDWQELTSDQFMRMTRRKQRIDLIIDGLKLNIDSGELHLINGEVIKPEIKILDISGKWLKLEGGAASVNNFDLSTSTMDVSTVSFVADFSPNSVYAAVMIRSRVTFTCTRMDWTGYDPK